MRKFVEEFCYGIILGLCFSPFIALATIGILDLLRGSIPFASLVDALEFLLLGVR